MVALGTPVFKWLIEIGKRFKERGVFPPSLCDFYTSQRDIEVAGIVELLFPDNERKISYILETKKILGASPWEMVRKRVFIYLGLPQNEKAILKNKNITTNTIFNVLDWVWMCAVNHNIPMEHVVKGERGIVRPAHIYPLSDIINVKNLKCRIDRLLAKMCMPDGFGNGMWHIKEANLEFPLPINKDCFLSAFFKLRGDSDKDTLKRAARILEIPILEMMYIEWGYEKIKKKHPQEIKRLETLYKKRFNAVSSYSKNNYFADIVPSFVD